MRQLSAMAQQITSSRPVYRLFLAAGLGGLAAFGQAPWDMWPVTLVALALLYGLLRNTPGWFSATMLGMSAGTGHFIVALSWIFEPFLVDAASHAWMAPFAVFSLSAFMGSYWAIAFGLARRIGGGLAFVGAFVIAEALRGWLFTGFPWAQMGHVLIDTPMLYWSSWIGALGLCALVIGVAIAVWHVGAGRRIHGVVGVVGFFVLYAAGSVLSPNADAGPNASIVRIVQPNAPQHEKWLPENLQMFYDRQREFTAAPGDNGRPDLVVWPETALPTMLEDSADLLAGISASAQGSAVVVGLRRTEGPRFYNSLIHMDGTGEVTGLYDKHHLVPFGEFMPLGALMGRFGIHGLAAEDGGGYSSGPGPQMLNLGVLGSAVPLICYEGVFARNILSAPERPSVILMITNDAWFGKVSGPYQHLAQARLRSAEQGIPMIRVANTGVSAVIDGAGQVAAHIPLGEAGWLDVPLPPTLKPTFYARTGDGPILVLAGLVLLCVFLFNRSAARHS
ncbi:MAG: apolipoprotein N-acyltransferase [Pseudomonadota bacterium]